MKKGDVVYLREKSEHIYVSDVHNIPMVVLGPDKHNSDNVMVNASANFSRITFPKVHLIVYESFKSNVKEQLEKMMEEIEK